MASLTTPPATTATTSTPPSLAAVPPRAKIPVPEQRVVLRGIGWDGYETILKLVGDRPAVRLTYDRGDLELMSPSVDHEVFKTRFGRLIETLTMELNIPCEGAGSTAWKKLLEDKG